MEARRRGREGKGQGERERAGAARGTAGDAVGGRLGPAATFVRVGCYVHAVWGRRERRKRKKKRRKKKRKRKNADFFQN
jgi:hypothetical protein